MGNQKLTRCMNPKKTPPCLSECDKGILPALTCKVGKGPQAAPLSRDAFLLMLSTMRRLLPNLCCLQHNGRPLLRRCCGYRHNPVHPATETRARMSSDLQAQLQRIQWRSQMMTAPFEIESWEGKSVTHPNPVLSLGNAWMMHTINFEGGEVTFLLSSPCPDVLGLQWVQRELGS